jgi:hypothetical protein
MNVARTVEEWVNRNLTDLEASYFVIEIHNALARFANGVCNKGMIACQSVNLITSNDLQIFLTSVKNKRSDAILKEDDSGDRFSVEIGNNAHVRTQRKKLSRKLCCGPEPLGPVRTESDVCLKDNLFSLVPYKARVV